MLQYRSPGVYKEEKFSVPTDGLITGVPVFLGLTESLPGVLPEQIERFRLRQWQEFATKFGQAVAGSHLAKSVYGFFENGGQQCYVIGLTEINAGAIEAALLNLPYITDFDLICAPDLIRLVQPEELPPLDGMDAVWESYIRRQLDKTPSSANPYEVLRLQKLIIDYCTDAGDCFAILDPLPDANLVEVSAQKLELNAPNAAIYYPWILTSTGLVPPCGHVAGIYTRTDAKTGVYKAPANEVLKDALGLEFNITNVEQDVLNPKGVNCLRSFPGRGIRVWGARSLASDESNVVYINIRRLLITIGRWAETNLLDHVFEPNNSALWERIKRSLTRYLQTLFDSGALQGSAQDQAFYVKCDAENNPAEVRDAGMLVVEVGLAVSVPGEFIILRLISTESGITISDNSQGQAAALASPKSGVNKSIKITFIDYNPASGELEGEYVQIVNQGTETVSLDNWSLTDAIGHIYRFSAVSLGPAEGIKLWTKIGTDTKTDLYWQYIVPIWNDTGDTATLRDQYGRIVDVYEY